MADNRDWMKTGTIQGMAEWLQSKASVGGGGCLFVCVVRVDDLAIAGDLALLPREVVNLIEDRGAELVQRLTEIRNARLAVLDRKRQREEKRASR